MKWTMVAAWAFSTHAAPGYIINVFYLYILPSNTSIMITNVLSLYYGNKNNKYLAYIE